MEMPHLHYDCCFCGADVVRYYDPKHGERLRFCSNSCKSEYQKLAKPVTREWLEDHYVAKGLDCVQIGQMVNRDPKSVWNWLIDFKIPTRPRGHHVTAETAREKLSPYWGRKHTEETKEKIRKIAIAAGRVPYRPEVGSYMKGRKGSNCPNWKGGITPERQALYSSYEWKECVKAVWSRDDATCQRCGLDHRVLDRKNENYRKFVLHHIVSFEVKELRAEPSNLLLLCRPCHLWVHSNQNVNKEFIRTIE